MLGGWLGNPPRYGMSGPGKRDPCQDIPQFTAAARGADDKVVHACLAAHATPRGRQWEPQRSADGSQIAAPFTRADLEVAKERARGVAIHVMLEDYTEGAKAFCRRRTD